MNQSTQRSRTIAAIHIIKNQLNMDEDSYRDALAQQFSGIRSSTQLDQHQLNRWLLHLKSLQRRSGLNTTGTKNEAMIKKCQALWIELRKRGVVQNGSDEALQNFVCNQTGAAALRMANSQQLYQAIEALKSWLDRTHR